MFGAPKNVRNHWHRTIGISTIGEGEGMGRGHKVLVPSGVSSSSSSALTDEKYSDVGLETMGRGAVAS